MTSACGPTACRAAGAIQAGRQGQRAGGAPRSPREVRRDAGTGAGTLVAARNARQRDRRAKSAVGRLGRPVGRTPRSGVTSQSRAYCHRGSARIGMKRPTFREGTRLCEGAYGTPETRLHCACIAAAIAFVAPTLTAASERRAALTVEAVAVPANGPIVLDGKLNEESGSRRR